MDLDTLGPIKCRKLRILTAVLCPKPSPQVCEAADQQCVFASEPHRLLHLFQGLIASADRSQSHCKIMPERG